MKLKDFGIFSRILRHYRKFFRISKLFFWFEGFREFTRSTEIFGFLSRFWEGCTRIFIVIHPSLKITTQVQNYCDAKTHLLGSSLVIKIIQVVELKR